MSQQRRSNAEKDRIRKARQVLAGDTVRPSPDPWAIAEGTLPLTPLQRNYALALIVLLLLGAVLAILTSSMLAATIPFFLLAIGLVAARFVF